ncbi:MAG: PD-(D/E)XK nuclease family protein, partial [Candidatus Aminicenantes bacterium]|nr:PD-(D/E)XK nuclease family protein [Candidatus Aminicenantes bacterium]
FFVENAEKERSRFVEQLLWERQKRDGRSGSDSLLRTVQYRVALKPDKPAPVGKTDEMAGRLREFRFSATSLDLYLRCPVRFYFRYVLNIREAEEVTPRLERMDIGTFVHVVLEDFFRPCLGRPLRPRDLDPGRLREVIDRNYAALYGGDEAGSAFLLKRQVERHLGDFLDRYQLPLIRELDGGKKPLIIDSLESDWKTDLAFGSDVFLLAARTDRIERRGEDTHILDYKTGSKEKYLRVSFEKLDPDDSKTWRTAVKSLQLPFYGLVLSRVLGLPAESLRGGVLMLGKNVLGRHIEVEAFNREDETVRREEAAKFERMTGLLLEEICDPRRTFEPLGHREDLCPECPYRTLCR